MKGSGVAIIVVVQIALAVAVAYVDKPNHQQTNAATISDIYEVQSRIDSLSGHIDCVEKIEKYKMDNDDLKSDMDLPIALQKGLQNKMTSVANEAAEASQACIGI